MFREVVVGSPLVGTTADNYFDRIKAGRNWAADDDSFLSTLRLLLYPRIPENDTTELTIIRDHQPAMPSQLGQEAPPRVSVLVYRWITEDEKKKLEEDTPAENWERVPKVRDFYRQKFYVNCWINRSKKAVIYVTEDLSLNNIHYLQASLPVVMPWYFEDSPVTETERKLINALCDSHGYEEYMQLIKEFAGRTGIREQRIHDMLGNVENGYVEQMLITNKRKLDDNKSSWEHLRQQQASIIQEKARLELEIDILNEKLKNPNECEIEEFFKSNKNLLLANVWNERDYVRYQFAVLCDISTWDEEEAEIMLDNQESCFYSPYNTGEDIPVDDIYDLLSAIFVQRQLILRFCGSFEVTFPGDIDTFRHENWTKKYPEAADYMPNTHLDEFQCWSQYATRASDFMYDGDLVGATEQCIGATEMLNFSDHTVICKFVYELFEGRGHDRKCISPSGDASIKMTPYEALNYIREGK